MLTPVLWGGREGKGHYAQIALQVFDASCRDYSLFTKSKGFIQQ